MKDSLLIFGTGSIAPEVIDFIERYELYNIIGFTIDGKNIKEETYHDLPVYPAEEIEKHVDPSKVKAFIAVSWYNHLNRVKREKFDYLKGKGFSFANLISPLATLRTDDIGEGNWIDDHAYLAFNVHVGNNNTLRPFSSVSHHSKIGNHSVLSGKSTISGHVVVGDQTYVGVAATVFNKLKIGNKCIIGGGSIIKKNVDDFSVCVASEAKITVTNEKMIETILTPNFATRFQNKKR